MEPDTDFDPKGFAESWWNHTHRLTAFEDHLLCAGDDGFDFGRTRTDWYDCSLEVDEVPPNVHLNEKQQRLLFDCGFMRCWLNHDDGWETYYVFSGDTFQATDGKRIDKRQAHAING